jgi:exonuclease SbcD
MMEKRGLHIVTSLEQALSPIHLEDADGPLHLNAIPYLDPYQISQHFRTQPVTNHANAGALLLDHLTRFRRLRKRAVRGLVAAYMHLEGGELCGSERPLGRLQDSTVKIDTLQGLSYGAFGYLHRAQKLGPNSELCYAGSLVTLGFEESGQVKGIQRIQVGAEGEAEISQIPLQPKRNFHQFEGSLETLLLGPARALPARDVCSLLLTDGEGPLGAEQLERLRRYYPNLVRIDRKSAPPDSPAEELPPTLSLFGEFYKTATGDDFDADNQAILRQALEARS